MSTQPPEIPGPDQALVPPPTSWHYDVAMAVLLGCLLAAPMAFTSTFALMSSTLLCCSLIMRSNLPRLALATAFVACLVQVLTVGTPTPSIIVVPVVVYSVARWSTQGSARLALAAGMIGSVLGPAVWLGVEDSAGADVFVDVLPALVVSAFGCMAMITAAYVLGRRRRDSVIARMQRQIAEEERQRHQVEERTQLVRINTVNERQRIARELHDIVAHSLSVIVVQAEGGKAIAAKRPEVAPQVLETIAETGRDALVEMRRIVGLLRNGGDGEQPDRYLPSPGLDDLADLVQRTGNAELVVRGALPSVSQALGLSIYRVVQESLTNVLKHGGQGAQAQVTVTAFPDRLDVVVLDDGRGAAAASDGLGNGLRGMRERLAVHGGQLDARPASGDGFVVHAVVPLEYGQRPVPETRPPTPAVPEPEPGSIGRRGVA